MTLAGTNLLHRSEGKYTLITRVAEPKLKYVFGPIKSQREENL